MSIRDCFDAGVIPSYTLPANIGVVGQSLCSSATNTLQWINSTNTGIAYLGTVSTVLYGANSPGDLGEVDLNIEFWGDSAFIMAFFKIGGTNAVTIGPASSYLVTTIGDALPVQLRPSVDSATICTLRVFPTVGEPYLASANCRVYQTGEIVVQQKNKLTINYTYEMTSFGMQWPTTGFPDLTSVQRVCHPPSPAGDRLDLPAGDRLDLHPPLAFPAGDGGQVGDEFIEIGGLDAV